MAKHRPGVFCKAEEIAEARKRSLVESIRELRSAGGAISTAIWKISVAPTMVPPLWPLRQQHTAEALFLTGVGTDLAGNRPRHLRCGSCCLARIAR